MGYTCKINTSKFKLFVDGKNKRGLLSFDDLKEKVAELSPLKEENICEVFNIKQCSCAKTYSISDLIEALEKVKEKHGNIPIWEYDSNFDCPKPYVPTFDNVVIVNKYNWSQYNTKHQEIHIENKPAMMIVKR